MYNTSLYVVIKFDICRLLLRQNMTVACHKGKIFNAIYKQNRKFFTAYVFDILKNNQIYCFLLLFETYENMWLQTL